MLGKVGMDIGAQEHPKGMQTQNIDVQPNFLFAKQKV